MTIVRLSSDEGFDSLLRRFNKKVQQDGILSEARQREFFEPPSIRRKKKEAAKRRKSAKVERPAARSLAAGGIPR